MSNFKKYLGFAGVFALITLNSCSNINTEINLSDYVLELNTTQSDFKIMQLTDVHLGLTSDLDREFNYLKNNITECNPDLIVLSGDTFLFGTIGIVDSFFDFLNDTVVELSNQNNKKIYYTYTFGNHDYQGDYNSYYICDRLLTYAGMNDSHCLFYDDKNDNIDGQTNFCIDIKYNNETKYRIYIIDSGTYHFTGLKYGYEVIAENQLDHYEQLSKINNENQFISLAFFHIPLFEFQTAWDLVSQGNTSSNNSYPKAILKEGRNDEKCCVGYTDEFSPYDQLYDIGIRGMFVGHDHINDTTITYTKSEERNESVVLSYGVKSTDQIYHTDDMLGYKTITLSNENISFSAENVTNVLKGTYEK